MMQDSCYVSNSSQFGLQFEYCGDFLTNSTNTNSNSQLLHPNSAQNSISNNNNNNTNNNNWIASEDSMNTSFGLPIDLDHLSSLFPFSPCNFKTDLSTQPATILTNNHHHINNNNNINNNNLEKQPQDLADVLLSLKHDSIHPESNSSPNQNDSNDYSPHPAYIQPQVSKSNNTYTTISTTNDDDVNGLCNSDQYLISSPSTNYHNHHHHHHHTTSPTIFPSMSVNVSMNMTMHGCSSTNLVCPEPIQWSAPAIQLSPPQHNQFQHHHQHLHHDLQQQMYSSSQNQEPTICASESTSAMYTYTADFRPQPTIDCSSDINYHHNNSNSSCDSNGSINGYKTKKGCQISTLIDSTNCSRKRSYYKGDKLSNLYFEEDSTKPNLCRICGKTYARPSTLKTHLRTHSGEKPYRCINCNKSFSQAANLTAHVRTHSGERPFRCPICDRRFSQSSSVTTHMRTHSGERPYCCRMCKKAFSDSSTLTKHLRIHSGEKPYQCKLCLLRFSQSGNLNRHMRVHGSTNSAILIS